MGGLLSLLGGTAFRMIWGELASFLTSQQDHKQELQRMAQQETIAAAQHLRTLESIKLQADMGAKEIQAKREEYSDTVWGDVARSTTARTGIDWLDGWNGSIRPLLASIAILMLCVEFVVLGFILTDYTREILAAAIGLFIGDRVQVKRGK